jgi:hypothetical protein
MGDGSEGERTMSDDVLGPVITGDDVRNAVIATVKRWAPSYLAVMARRTVVAPGLLTQPTREKHGYRARWGVGIGCVVAGKDRDNTYSLATLYTAAVRSLVVQNSSLGGFADGTEWISERYDNLDTSDLRTIAAGIIQLGIDVVAVVNPRAGLGEPLVDITVQPPDQPVVDQVFIDV